LTNVVPYKLLLTSGRLVILSYGVHDELGQRDKCSITLHNIARYLYTQWISTHLETPCAS